MPQIRLVAGLGLALALLVLTPRHAAAHARPERAEPAIEGVVATAPDTLRVWFSEEPAAQGSALEVIDSADNRVDRGDSRLDLNDPDRKLMLVSLPALADGVYTVRWRTLSRDDGDAAEGTFRFGVGVDTVLPPLPAAEPRPRVAIEHATVNGAAVGVHVHGDAVTLREPAVTLGMGHGAEAAAYGGPVEGHFHVYLDGLDVRHTWEHELTLNDVPSGRHQVMVELHANDHKLYTSPSTAMAAVVVTE